MRVKGGMYCERCKKPVEAIRQGHPAHHTISGVTGPLTRNWEQLDYRAKGGSARIAVGRSFPRLRPMGSELRRRA